VLAPAVQLVLAAIIAKPHRSTSAGTESRQERKERGSRGDAFASDRGLDEHDVPPLGTIAVSGERGSAANETTQTASLKKTNSISTQEDFAITHLLTFYLRSHAS
jgi:hypothetical protein